MKNIIDVKDSIRSNIGKKVRIVVRGMRNKREVITGIINCTYNNIFTVLSKNMTRSFSYSDVLIGEVKVEYM